MAFKHTPSTTVTTTTPDKFTDDDGTVYLAGYVEYNTNDPREDWDGTGVELYVYYSAIRATDDRASKPEHPAIRAFLHYYDNDFAIMGFNPDESALIKARRYMAAFHPEWRGIIELTPGHGYCQGDWHHAVTVIDNAGDWEPTTDDAVAVANEYTNWRYGNVFWVEREADDWSSVVIADSMEDAVIMFKEGIC